MNKNLYSKFKLLKHLDRISEFEKTGITRPIFVDWSLTNACNNKCPLCISNEDRKENRTTVSIENAFRVIKEMKELDVKAVYLTGGGDPSCHPNLEGIIKNMKNLNIDVALCTNGYKLSDNLLETINNCCSFIRISLDADSPEIYKKTHGMEADAFYQVLENMKKLVERRTNNSELVIGASYLIGPHTIQGISNAAKLCKGIGIDYIRFRPFFEWMGKNKSPLFEKIEGREFSEKDKELMLEQFKKAEEFNDNKFSASYPKERVESVLNEVVLKYPACYISHFISAIDSNLKVYPCCNLRYNEKYCFGDLNEKSFKEIWLSEKRKKSHEIIKLKDCPKPCQYNVHNELLSDILGEIKHSNFL